MAKKSFRARKADGPNYPKLTDLQPGALRRWGLAAVGGLLIGGGGCTRTSGVPIAREPVVHSTAQSGAQNHVAPLPDGGAPTEPGVRFGGIRPVQRVDSETTSQTSTTRESPQQPPKPEAGKKVKQPRKEPRRLAGKLPMPRVGDKKTDEW
jgi:hypothetical protein